MGKPGTKAGATPPFSLYQKRGRWYVNLRRLGGGLRACIPPDSKEATAARDVAEDLALQWAGELQTTRRAAERLGYRASLALKPFGMKQIDAAELKKDVTAGWAKIAREYLGNALYFFETVQPQQAENAADRRRMAAPRNMESVSAPDVVALQEWLRLQPNGRGGVYSEQTVRHHCTILSGIYRRAIRQGRMTENPVAAAGLPTVPETDTPLMEVEEVALALAAARRVQDEAWVSADPRLSGRRVVYITLATLAYTGARMDEARRLDFLDVMESAGRHFLRVHSARKGKGRRRARTRLVPLSPHYVEALAEWRRLSGRVAGPILADPETGSVPVLVKAFAAVERRANLPAGLLGSRTLRVAYASHRSGCDGVTWNDVRDELGHASLEMQARVYGRGRLNREPMGEHMDYRLQRWAHVLGAQADRLAASTATPDSWALRRDERSAVIRDFLAAVEGMGMKKAHKTTGVDRSVIQRLRTGRCSDVKTPSLQRMNAYLESVRQVAA